MKKLIILKIWILAVALPATAQADVIKSQVGSLIEYQISIDAFRWERVTIAGSDYVTPSLEGIAGYDGVLYQPGAPRIPVVRLYLDGVKNLEIQWGETRRELQAIDDVGFAPLSQPVPKVPGAVRSTHRDTEVYNAEALFPTRMYTIRTVASVRGKERKLLTLFPLSLNAQTGEVRLTANFRVRFVEESKSESYDPQTVAFVVAQRFASSPALAQYIAHKESQGFETTTIVYGQDVNSVDGIRQALQDLYNDDQVNLTDAVLIGDSGGLPAKNARHMSGITDHYYRAIDTSNYESDIAGPDIGVGRISVETEEQLQNVVNKYLRYDNSDFTTDQWLGEISWIASNDGRFFQVAEGTHNYVVDTYATDRSYVGHFPQANYPGGDKLYIRSHRASSSDIASAIRSGRSFVTFSGHGSPSSWEGFRSSTILSFDRPDYMPFVMGFACDTGDYRGSNGLAENWIRHEYGGIHYFGSVDSSYWDEDDILEKRIFDSIFADDERSIGVILNFGLAELYRHLGGAGLAKYYWESYTSFGDPTMKLKVR